MDSRTTLPTLATALIAAILFGGSAPVRAADVAGVLSVAAANSGEAQDLSRTVAFLDADPALAAAPKSDEPNPQIIQRGKAFVPDLLVVRQGTTVEFPNWDPFSHNVFSRSPAAQFDLDRYGQGQSKSVPFNNVGLVQIFCNIHPQMKASLLVVPNRYFAHADAQGRFAIRDVPPGRYVLIGWGLRAGEQRQAISVGPEGLRDVALTLPGAVNRETAAIAPAPRERTGSAPGVERGLGVKRERLNLPVVGDTHAAPGPRSSP
jgi:plastocyanin